MRVFILSTVIFLSFISSAFAGLFNAQTSMLSNGMQIVLIENHRSPVVTHMLWYKIGGGDEPDGQTGLTHFLEHLMFKGTDDVPSGEFSKRVAAMGGFDNAYTTHDNTTYYQSVARRYLPVVMKMEADRMRNLNLSDKDIEAEREVVLQERKERYDNNPNGRFWEKVAERAFVGHPYARPVIGLEEDIRNLTRQQIMDYYNQWYVPNNAVLIVAGDITMDELLPLAQKYYGDIEANWELPSRVLGNKKVSRTKAETIIKHDIQVKQPQWVRIYPVPAVERAYTKQADALSVFANLLGGGTTGLLYQKLVIEQKLAVQATASYNGTRRSIAQFGISIVPAEGISMDTITQSVDALMDNLATDGVDAKLISRTKERIITATDYALDSLDGPPSIVGNAIMANVTIPNIESFPERIQSVDKAIVDAVAKNVASGNVPKRFFPPLTAYLLPEEE